MLQRRREFIGVYVINKYRIKTLSCLTFLKRTMGTGIILCWKAPSVARILEQIKIIKTF